MCYSDAEKQAVSHTRRTPEAFSRISRLYLILNKPKGGISMDTPALRVQTLGGFSIRRGEAALTGGRSRKLFLLLAFLIWERARPVSYGELTDLLWAGREGGSLNALKAVLHRARSALDQLGPGCGKALILSREGGCQWNPEVPLVLDTEDFARLLAAGDLESRLEALALYRGDFLPSLAGHPWADARSEALRRQYLETLLAVLPALAEADRRQEIADLSVTACALEPCREDLCRLRMEALLRLGRCQEAAQAYGALHDHLLSRLGVLPSQALRDLYREALGERDPRAVSPATLLETLLEPPRSGSLLCGFDAFRTICHSTARMAGRSGRPVHIALLTAAGDDSLARRSLDRAMDHLEEVLREGLRRGDAAARCGAGQFILLLPQADYDASRTVCARLVRSFTRRYPHSPVRITCFVQPLPPN